MNRMYIPHVAVLRYNAKNVYIHCPNCQPDKDVHVPSSCWPVRAQRASSSSSSSLSSDAIEETVWAHDLDWVVHSAPTPPPSRYAKFSIFRSRTWWSFEACSSSLPSTHTFVKMWRPKYVFWDWVDYLGTELKVVAAATPPIFREICVLIKSTLEFTYRRLCIFVELEQGCLKTHKRCLVHIAFLHALPTAFFSSCSSLQRWCCSPQLSLRGYLYKHLCGERAPCSNGAVGKLTVFL